MQNYDKVRQYRYRSSLSSSSGTSHVVQGSKVCVRSSPIYGAGGKVVHLKGTQLQCGILLSDIVSPSLTEKCSFKVISGEMAELGKVATRMNTRGSKSVAEKPGESSMHIGKN